MTKLFKKDPYKKIWILSWPTILSNLTVPLLGAVDTAVMGHLPDASYIGGVAIGSMIFSFIYWGFGFLRMGTVGFVAQAKGSKNLNEVRAVLARALLIGITISLVLIFLQDVIKYFSFMLVVGEVKVEYFAEKYFDIRIWGAPATLANYGLLGWLLGMQYVRMALVIQLFINSLNIFLDLIFVFKFNWGVEGVALATALSQYSGFILGLILILLKLKKIGGKWKRSIIFDKTALSLAVKVNRDIFLRTLALILSWSLVTWTSAGLGTTVLAVNAILMNFQSFLAHGLDGFASATSALVGESLGAGDKKELRRNVIAATIMAVIVAGIYTIVYLIIGNSLVALFTNIDELRDYSSNYLVWIFLSPLISVWAYQLDGIFIGATLSKEMRNAMILSATIYCLCMGILPYEYGNHGIWLSIMLFMVVRALTLIYYYPRVEKVITKQNNLFNDA
ncbi:MAG: MATE family efflux transporter [Alphaproteobacteria bacterium]|nr:MATE family efflux transporter [Alphaproteobacteria bacterium]PPR14512.1 MAG: DNA-damage-inducible protein F [Alphaproteobacteria bacterium MarineAlpha12_Bin1]